MAHQGRHQGQDGHRQGVGKQGCTQACEREMISKQKKFDPQITKGQSTKQNGNSDSDRRITTRQTNSQGKNSKPQFQL